MHVIGYTEPGKPHEDSEILPEIRALAVRGRAPYFSVTEAPILNLYEWARKIHFVSLKLEGRSRFWTCDPRLYKQAASTTAPDPPPSISTISCEWWKSVWNEDIQIWTGKNCEVKLAEVCLMQGLYHEVMDVFMDRLTALPSKSDILTQFCFNVGPVSKAVGQH